MTHVTERNFNTFILGDDPTMLADGVVREIAQGVGIAIGEDQVADLGALVGSLGAHKELRNNQDLTDIWTPAEAADLVEQSGVQHEMNRSLWTPDQCIPEDAALVLTGAVANWQDRNIAHATQLPGHEVYMALGNRVMGSPTELSNPNVQRFHDENDGKLPTEFKYGDTFGTPKIHEIGKLVRTLPFMTDKGDQIADAFMDLYPELVAPGKHIAAVRVANAGVQLAVQLRKAARIQNPDFDTDPENPQLFIATDGRALARTETEVQDAANLQSPYTAMRQVALTAKLLAEKRA